MFYHWVTTFKFVLHPLDRLTALCLLNQVQATVPPITRAFGYELTDIW